MPNIGHVFIVVLENEAATTTFGAGTPATYLVDTLAPQGALVNNYYGIGHFSLDNYTAMISGQAPDTAQSDDCGVNTDFVAEGWSGLGQIVGDGCTYPKEVRTLANEMQETGITWKGYFEDMGNDPDREADRCGHVPIGAVDITDNQQPFDQYAARHNPFVWFHSITDYPLCNNVVPLAGLEADLSSLKTTPQYVFISPNVCHDGHDKPCVDGEPGGLVSANSWLQDYIPLILNSAAYKTDGLLMIIFDESEGSDATACCNEQAGPNQALPGRVGPGGGRTGAVFLSQFIKPGTVSNVPYNHYSLLLSVENIFALEPLGMAAQPGLVPFGKDIFTGM